MFLAGDGGHRGAVGGGRSGSASCAVDTAGKRDGQWDAIPRGKAPQRRKGHALTGSYAADPARVEGLPHLCHAAISTSTRHAEKWRRRHRQSTKCCKDVGSVHSMTRRFLESRPSMSSTLEATMPARASEGEPAASLVERSLDLSADRRARRRRLAAHASGLLQGGRRHRLLAGCGRRRDDADAVQLSAAQVRAAAAPPGQGEVGGSSPT